MKSKIKTDIVRKLSPSIYNFQLTLSRTSLLFQDPYFMREAIKSLDEQMKAIEALKTEIKDCMFRDFNIDLDHEDDPEISA